MRMAGLGPWGEGEAWGPGEGGLHCRASAQPMTLTLKGAHSLTCKLVFAASWVPVGQGSFGGGGSPASSREAVSPGGIPTGPSVVR